MNIITKRVIIIYLDSCCYGRRFDIKTHPTVKAEAAKIQAIIRNRMNGRYVIVGSFVVESEVGQITDAKKRAATEKHYEKAIDSTVEFSTQITARAKGLESKGLGKMDAVHLAAAENAGADFLLTTDMDFIKKCKDRNLTTVKVINPLNFNF